MAVYTEKRQGGMNGANSEENPLEVVNNISRELSEFSEKWRNKRIIWQNVGLVERYVRGKLSLHLHILASVGSVAHQYCIVYERAGVNIVDGKRNIAANTDLTGLLSDNAEAAVLVDDVQFVDDPEAVTTQSEGVFLKRLQFLHDCPCGIREDGESFLPSTVEVRFIAENGELQLLPAGRRVLLGFMNGQSVDKVIQAAPETMHHLPNNPANLRRGFGSTLTDYDILSGFGVVLMDNFALICIKPILADFIEFREVLVRPL
jgi:hypothetical protein